jgi:hypothetical protein
MKEYARHSMKTSSLSYWVPVVALLLIALPLQRWHSFHQKNLPIAHRCAVSDLPGDSPGLEKRLKPPVFNLPSIGVAEQTAILVRPNQSGVIKARDIILSRQASAQFSFLLLISQTTSSFS